MDLPSATLRRLPLTNRVVVLSTRYRQPSFNPASSYPGLIVGFIFSRSIAGESKKIIRLKARSRNNEWVLIVCDYRLMSPMLILIKTVAEAGVLPLSLFQVIITWPQLIWHLCMHRLVVTLRMVYGSYVKDARLDQKDDVEGCHYWIRHDIEDWMDIPCLCLSVLDFQVRVLIWILSLVSALWPNQIIVLSLVMFFKFPISGKQL